MLGRGGHCGTPGDPQPGGPGLSCICSVQGCSEPPALPPLSLGIFGFGYRSGTQQSLIVSASPSFPLFGDISIYRFSIQIWHTAFPAGFSLPIHPHLCLGDISVLVADLAPSIPCWFQMCSLMIYNTLYSNFSLVE